MWPCYGVHITVCMALLVFVLCQPVHSCIMHWPSLYGLDFFLEIFLLRLVIYISNHYVDGVSITYGTLNTHIWTYATTLRENPATVFSDLKCPCNKLIHVTQVPHHSLIMTTTVKLEHFTCSHHLYSTLMILCGMVCSVKEEKDLVITILECPGLTRAYEITPLMLSMCVSE